MRGSRHSNDGSVPMMAACREGARRKRRFSRIRQDILATAHPLQRRAEAVARMHDIAREAGLTAPPLYTSSASLSLPSTAGTRASISFGARRVPAASGAWRARGALGVEVNAHSRKEWLETRASAGDLAGRETREAAAFPSCSARVLLVEGLSKRASKVLASLSRAPSTCSGTVSAVSHEARRRQQKGARVR